jgi:PEP-CTERM motif-containing protein
MMKFFSGAAALLLLSGQLAGGLVTIDFENRPSLPAQPSNFAAAGAMQTYSDAGFNITGGVVLGNPSFLAGFPGPSTPTNLYGTTDIADPSLLATITLTFPMSDGMTALQGVLFNGQAFPEDYTISAFSGITPLPGVTFTGVPAASSPSDWRSFGLSETMPITMLAITTPNAGINGWDFFVDDITQVPEPSSVPLLLLTGGALLWARRRRCI